MEKTESTQPTQSGRSVSNPEYHEQGNKEVCGNPSDAAVLRGYPSSGSFFSKKQK